MLKTDIIDPIVREFCRHRTRPMIDTTIREIQAEVIARTGLPVSTSEIFHAMRRIKATNNGHRWSWKHIEEHE